MSPSVPQTPNAHGQSHVWLPDAPSGCGGSAGSVRPSSRALVALMLCTESSSTCMARLSWSEVVIARPVIAMMKIISSTTCTESLIISMRIMTVSPIRGK